MPEREKTIHACCDAISNAITTGEPMISTEIGMLLLDEVNRLTDQKQQHFPTSVLFDAEQMCVSIEFREDNQVVTIAVDETAWEYTQFIDGKVVQDDAFKWGIVPKDES